VARTPLHLTESILRTYRPGGLVAIALGASAGIPQKQPRIGRARAALASSMLGDVGRRRFEVSRGYSVVARSQVAAAGSRGALPPPAPGTAIVPIRGVIEQRADLWSCGETTGYDLIEADICEALCDPGVGSLVVDCDSPGGDVPGLAEGTARISNFRAQLAAEGMAKPVLGVANEFCASAALYLVLGICDAFYLPRSARAGSISSAVVFHSESRALVKEGIDVYIARGLPGKMKPNPLEPLDELGKKRLDDLAMACSEDFIAFVAERRAGRPNAPTADIIRSWSADIFTGEAVVAAGLADGIGSFDQIVALAGELAGAAQEAA